MILNQAGTWKVLISPGLAGIFLHVCCRRQESCVTSSKRAARTCCCGRSRVVHSFGLIFLNQVKRNGFKSLWSHRKLWVCCLCVFCRTHTCVCRFSLSAVSTESRAWCSLVQLDLTCLTDLRFFCVKIQSCSNSKLNRFNWRCLKV